MTAPSEHHGHSTAAIDPQAAFSPTEWAGFQKSDIHAGGAVVLLMAAIFTVGLVLYTIVLVSVL